MSYCRFQNTSKDLDECADALEEVLASEGEPLSREEEQAAKKLVELCVRVVGMITDAAQIFSDEEIVELVEGGHKSDAWIEGAITRAVQGCRDQERS